MMFYDFLVVIPAFVENLILIYYVFCHLWTAQIAISSPWWHLFCLFIIVISCSLLKIKIWKLYHVCINSTLAKSSAISVIHHHLAAVLCLTSSLYENCMLQYKLEWKIHLKVSFPDIQDHYHLPEKPLGSFLCLLVWAKCSLPFRLGYRGGRQELCR